MDNSMSVAARTRPAVLVALDSDPSAWRLDSALIEHGVRLAQRLGADMTLLHVGYQPQLSAGQRLDRQALDSRRLRYLANQRTRQQALAAQISDRFALRVQVSTRWDDDRREAILQTANRRPTAVIVKTADHQSGDRPVSAADADLIRRAPAPIWLVAPSGTPDSQPLRSTRGPALERISGSR